MILKGNVFFEIVLLKGRFYKTFDHHSNKTLKTPFKLRL